MQPTDGLSLLKYFASVAVPGGGCGVSQGVIPGTGRNGSSTNALAAIQHQSQSTAEHTEPTSPARLLRLKHRDLKETHYNMSLVADKYHKNFSDNCSYSCKFLSGMSHKQHSFSTLMNFTELMLGLGLLFIFLQKCSHYCMRNKAYSNCSVTRGKEWLHFLF